MSFVKQIYLPRKEQNIFFVIFARIVSFFFAFIVNLRNRLYDAEILKSYSLPGRVLSVGNITLGGTGKSPVVMELVQHLVEAGKKPVILTRGYKSSLKRNQIIILFAGKILRKNFSSDVIHLPDEALMYSHRCPTIPIIVSRNRFLAAQWYLKGKLIPTHWVLDDGFQHRQIKRDFDLVLLDAEKPFGNEQIFPLGSLREPVGSLKRAHYLIYTRATQSLPSAFTETYVNKITSVPKEKWCFDFAIYSMETLTFNKNYEPVLLLGGIAGPERFMNHVVSKGIVVKNYYFVPDHENFDEGKVLILSKNCRSILTTEKDYWRNPDFFTKNKIPFFIAKLHVFSKESSRPSVFDFIQ